MIKKRIAGQSIIEYVTLFIIISAAIAVTHKYVYRSMNARLKQIQEELEYKPPTTGAATATTTSSKGG